MYVYLYFYNALHSTRKAYQICAYTEPSTLTCRDADRGREDIEHSEYSRGGDGYSYDLIHRQGLTRNKEQGKSNGYTFHNVLDQASQKVVHVHGIYPLIDFFRWSPFKVNTPTKLRNEHGAKGGLLVRRS